MSAREAEATYFPGLKNLLWILGLFTVWFGFVSTSTYYSQFGISYYSLSIPVQHMLNRGLTIILSNPLFVVIFLFIFAVQKAADSNFRFKLMNIVISPAAYAPAFLSLIFLIGWYASFALAAKAAYRDMYLDTSNLSILTGFKSANKDKDAYVNTLREGRKSVFLLYADKDQIIIFKEPELKVDIPKIPVHHIPLEKTDVYSRRAAS